MERQTKTGRIDTVSKRIDATPHKLYQAYMNPDSLIKWLPPEGMKGEVGFFEPRIGGRYRLTLTYETAHETAGKTTEDSDTIEGTFLELVSDKKIVEAGVFASDNPDFVGEMIMSWYFEEVLEGTKVTIVAENVPEGIKKSDHINGLNSTLENLAAFVETW